MQRGVKGPERPTRPDRLHTPELRPTDMARMVREFGGDKLAAKTLRISTELLSKWQSGELEPPYTAMAALFWLSPAGLRAAFDQSHWTHSYNSFLKDEARARVAVLERAMQMAGMPLPPGRLTSSAEALLAGPDDWLTPEYRQQLIASVEAQNKPKLAHQVNVTGRQLESPRHASER